jgi:hypothetical protein
MSYDQFNCTNVWACQVDPNAYEDCSNPDSKGKKITFLSCSDHVRLIQQCVQRCTRLIQQCVQRCIVRHTKIGQTCLTNWFGRIREGISCWKLQF